MGRFKRICRERKTRRQENERVNGDWGFEDKNESRERILKFPEAYDFGIVNSFFKKEMSIFTSWLFVDKKRNVKKKGKGCKPIPGESVVS